MCNAKNNSIEGMDEAKGKYTRLIAKPAIKKEGSRYLSSVKLNNRGMIMLVNPLRKLSKPTFFKLKVILSNEHSVVK
jgi:hypothetical protein